MSPADRITTACLARTPSWHRECKGKKYHRVERSYGAFTRSFTLPEDADETKISAEYKDGVLNIHLPKCENPKPKLIEVKVS